MGYVTTKDNVEIFINWGPKDAPVIFLPSWLATKLR